jgi:hypothetical protein
MHSLPSGTSSQLASLEQDISVLCNNLTALHDMARSLPVGVTVPIDKRAAFAELDARVNRDFDRLSYALAAVESGALY